MLQGIGPSTSRQAGAPKMPHYGACPPPPVLRPGNSGPPAKEVGNLRIGKKKQGLETKDYLSAAAHSDRIIPADSTKNF